MAEGLEAVLHPWIETFRSRSSRDLHPHWRVRRPGGLESLAIDDPWGRRHRPDWFARGLIIWPRGGQELRLSQRLVCPEPWLAWGQLRARLVLRWWAEAAELRVDGETAHRGDLFDTACRWTLPERWWAGEPLELELTLRSPRHDDGALILSRLELEPTGSDDPHGVLLAQSLELVALRGEGEGTPGPLVERLTALDPASPSERAAALDLLRGQLRGLALPAGAPGFHVLGHAHLDLAWLWPVADTWQAAERTFRSALELMERHPQLHFGHSTPALYAWLERHRPALFAAIRAAMVAGRWEPINGPWVESDCVLIATASLWRQFEEGQAYSRSRFHEWEPSVAWLPDSFGFGAGLPAVAAASGVRWFCTHKLAWNATNPFPHRLFRWRSRCGAEVLALMTAPIGTDGDPVAMERYRQGWRRSTGLETALWLPGVGDHGGGPTAEMLEQLELWQGQPLAAPQRHGSLRAYLAELEPHQAQLPIWRDELYLELHRGIATSRPDQKRHNRSLERLLREAELAEALRSAALHGPGDPIATEAAGRAELTEAWRTLLFQQFHDILPGTSVPEVFEQAEPQWHQARRLARRQRDDALGRWLDPRTRPVANPWWLVQLQALEAAPLTVRLPRGDWRLADGSPLPRQPARSGGDWVQLRGPQGVAAVPLERRPLGGHRELAGEVPGAIDGPVISRPSGVEGHHWLGNGLLAVQVGPQGVEQLWSQDGVSLLKAPLEWRRWRDRGAFWDAWDLADDYRDHPLPLEWDGPPEPLDQGPLCAGFRWRGRCGTSALRLELRLRAACPWLELILAVDWRQTHELLRLELPLAQRAERWAADTSGGVIERPAEALTARERSRWELPAISWLASQAGNAGGLAVLLDGPQGVSASADRLGVSLLRGPTWPDPGADRGHQRLRVALLPLPGSWRAGMVPQQAVRFREPLWLRPAEPGPGSGLESEVGDGLHLGHPDLLLLGLKVEGPSPQGPVLLLSAQNLGPCRRWLALPRGWTVLKRIDGLPGPKDDSPDDGLLLRPWQLARWRIRRSWSA